MHHILFKSESNLYQNRFRADYNNMPYFRLHYFRTQLPRIIFRFEQFHRELGSRSTFYRPLPENWLVAKKIHHEIVGVSWDNCKITGKRKSRDKCHGQTDTNQLKHRVDYLYKAEVIIQFFITISLVVLIAITSLSSLFGKLVSWNPLKVFHVYQTVTIILSRRRNVNPHNGIMSA